MSDGPELIRSSILSMQVCVPKTFTDEQVVEFAESVNPCGTEMGWSIRREGDPLLVDAPERVQCTKYPLKCHIVLDA